MECKIKCEKVWELIQDYKSRINEENYDNDKEKETEFINNYRFIDIRKNVKKKPSFPHLESSKEELLFDYEKLLEKKKKYIILDTNGMAAGIVCQTLNYFGYDCFYIKGGLQSYKKWIRSHKRR